MQRKELILIVQLRRWQIQQLVLKYDVPTGINVRSIWKLLRRLLVNHVIRTIF